MTSGETRSGYWAGDEDNPAKYRLLEHIVDGGEGTVWRAVRQVDGVDKHWALKILLPERLRDDGETRAEALLRWKELWEETIARTMVIRAVPGIVPVSDAFVGVVPHPQKAAPRHAERTLYLGTPWVDGATLESWVGTGPSRTDVIDVVTKLCTAVDALADHDYVHRDLCTRNVMVDGANGICLIDFAFMMRAGAEMTVALRKPGYVAPEVHADRTGAPPVVDPAIDRYAVGAIVHRLLSGHVPPDHGAHVEVRRALVEAGERPALARHVARLLDPDPANRPDRLGPWATEFRRLASVVGGRGYTDVAVTTLGSRDGVVVAGGADRVAVATVAATTHLTLRSESGSPMSAGSVAVARNGDGSMVAFARDETHRLHVRSAGRWTIVRNLQGRGAVRVTEVGDGTVAAFVLDHRAHLVEVRVAPGGGEPVQVAHRTGRLRQVYAATCGPDGGPVLVVESGDGQVHCGPPDRLRPVGLSGARTAAVCVNAHNELVCVAGYGADATRIDVIGSPGGEWIDRDRCDAPAGLRDLSCAWLRTGLSVAAAADSGLWVSTDGSADWQRLWAEPVTRVVLNPGVGWRLQVAAVAEGQVLFAEEITAGLWPSSASQL